MSIHPIGRAIVEKYCDVNAIEIGKRYPDSEGRLVEIEDGRFWGEYGVSNFWYWRLVQQDGSLSEILYHGYGDLKATGDENTPQYPSTGGEDFEEC